MFLFLDRIMSKIGINGFGRIGRLVLRASLERGGQVKKTSPYQTCSLVLKILVVMNVTKFSLNYFILAIKLTKFKKQLIIL